MSPKIITFLLFFAFFSQIYSQNEKKPTLTIKKERHLLPFPLYNISGSKNIKNLKLHSKLLQTVYSDSYSKNFYYTTLYLGDNKSRQTFLIDTGSSVMSSPCSPCKECGAHKSPSYYDMQHKHKPLKCNSKICSLVPATNCDNKDISKFLKKSCSFNISTATGEGISGYYMRDIVYLETDVHLDRLPLHRKVFRSYALPVGCTTGEEGKYKELNTDGIMGMSNNPKSFISLLYNLRLINRNIFTLCFGLRGGYLSLGEVDSTHHKGTPQYIPLLTSNINYLVKVSSLTIGPEGKNVIKTPLIASVETGNTISYLPSILYKSVTREFHKYCSEPGRNCGNFTYSNEYGYCADFPNREVLFRAIFFIWPNITLNFENTIYLWKPVNYYYYHFDGKERKACLGFNYHSSDKIILGANFIHGHDIIFDRENKRLGFVPADCSRGNLIWNRVQNSLGLPKFETTDPILMDKELHHDEDEHKFHLGDNNSPDMVDFIEGHNTELDAKEFKAINYIILIVSIIIVSIIVIVVVAVLLCGRKKIKYEQQEAEYSPEEENNQNEPKEIDTSDNDKDKNNEIVENKISFENSNNQVENIDDSN